MLIGKQTTRQVMSLVTLFMMSCFPETTKYVVCVLIRRVQNHFMSRFHFGNLDIRTHKLRPKTCLIKVPQDLRWDRFGIENRNQDRPIM